MATVSPAFEIVARDPEFVSLALPFPTRAFLWSLLTHALLFSLWTCVPPQLRFADSVSVRYEPLDPSKYTTLSFSGMPTLYLPAQETVADVATSSSTDAKPAPRQVQGAFSRQLPKARAVYAGPQPIISNLADATNSVQTIRLPESVAPPKVRFPLALQSLIISAPSAAPRLAVAPTAITTEPQAVTSAATPVKEPALPVEQHTTTQAEADHSQEVARSAARSGVANEGNPSLLPGAPSSEKPVTVVNAVSVPSDTRLAVPDVEVSGNFAVVPFAASDQRRGPQLDTRGKVFDGKASTSPGKPPSPNAVGGHAAAMNERKGRDSATNLSANSREIAKHEARKESAPARRSKPERNSKPATARIRVDESTLALPSGSVGTPSAKVGLPGIVIIGAAPEARSRTAEHIATSTRPGYGMTIISGGSSGGPTRDLGVFGREETVYTVYISMADAGGGGDWSMQYSLFAPAESGGMLSPPVAVRKIPARLPKGSPVEGLVFVTAIINDSGILKAIRPLQPAHPAAQLVTDTLKQWDFLPAQMNGRAVATKVLIGVPLSYSEQ